MSGKAKALARTLLRENKKNGKSWRELSREMFDGKINHATLNRIANSKGAWLPKDESLLIALGLKQPRQPKKQMPKDLFDMCRAALLKALQNRETMPPPDPRILNQFVKLGWMEKERIRTT